VSDPGDYRWCGYAETIAGKLLAAEDFVTVTGWTAERVHGRAPGAPAPVETDRQRRLRELQALVRYRRLLGIAGRPRVDEDGRVLNRSGYRFSDGTSSAIDLLNLAPPRPDTLAASIPLPFPLPFPLYHPPPSPLEPPKKQADPVAGARLD
jgi:hypothetical protein